MSVQWGGNAVRVCWLWALVLAMVAAFAQPAAAQPLPRSVLIFDFTDTNSPWGLAFRSTVRSELSKGSKTPIALYSEVLELGRFNSPQYQELLRTYLREKYRDRPIGVIIVHGSLALEVFMRLRAELWPSVPVVFTFVDPDIIARLEPAARHHWNNVSNKSSQRGRFRARAGARSQANSPGWHHV